MLWEIWDLLALPCPLLPMGFCADLCGCGNPLEGLRGSFMPGCWHLGWVTPLESSPSRLQGLGTGPSTQVLLS